MKCQKLWTNGKSHTQIAQCDVLHVLSNQQCKTPCIHFRIVNTREKQSKRYLSVGPSLLNETDFLVPLCQNVNLSNNLVNDETHAKSNAIPIGLSCTLCLVLNIKLEHENTKHSATEDQNMSMLPLLL